MPSALVTGLLALLGFQLLGEAVVRLLGVPFPGSVLGMVLLAVVLRRGWIPMEVVRPAADVLLRNLALFFVPPGVGLMLYGALLRAEWAPILAANAAGVVAVLLVVGLVYERLARPASGDPDPARRGGAGPVER